MMMLCFISLWTQKMVKKTRPSALFFHSLNGAQVIIFVFTVNWYGFHANLSCGKVDEDL